MRQLILPVFIAYRARDQEVLHFCTTLYRNDTGSLLSAGLGEYPYFSYLIEKYRLRRFGTCCAVSFVRLELWVTVRYSTINIKGVWP